MTTKPCLFAVPILALSALFAAHSAYGGEDKLGPYKQIATVTVPSGLAGGFDIVWADSEAGRIYLADRGNSKVNHQCLRVSM